MGAIIGNRTCLTMATELEQWSAFGGTVEDQKTRTGRKSTKIYVAPTGACVFV